VVGVLIRFRLDVLGGVFFHSFLEFRDNMPVALWPFETGFECEGFGVLDPLCDSGADSLHALPLKPFDLSWVVFCSGRRGLAFGTTRGTFWQLCAEPVERWGAGLDPSCGADFMSLGSHFACPRRRCFGVGVFFHATCWIFVRPTSDLCDWLPMGGRCFGGGAFGFTGGT